VKRSLLPRLIHLGLVLAIVSAALAFLIDLTPGDPAYAILGTQATPQQVALVNRQLHLNEPFYQRYGDWVGGLFHLDFGTSYITGQPVRSLIAQALPVTAELVLLTMVVSMAVSVPLGSYLGYRAGGRVDRLWQLVSSVLVAVPTFVTALGLVYVFAVALGHTPLRLPPTGWIALSDSVGGNVVHLILPVGTLALPEIATYTRVLRSDLISTLQEDYILAARARGLSPFRIVVGHALRPSSFSLLTLAGLSLGRMLGSAVVVETLFALPGLGQLLVNSVLSRDVPTVEGIVMFIALVYVLVNAGLDMGYGVLDPRSRVHARLS
jgi:peptide/nickel transport system permease protein